MKSAHATLRNCNFGERNSQMSVAVTVVFSVKRNCAAIATLAPTRLKQPVVLPAQKKKTSVFCGESAANKH